MGNAQQREHSRSGDSGSNSPLGRASADSALAYEHRRRRHSSQDESPLVLPGRRSATASPAGYHPPLSHQRSAPVGVPRPDPEPEADAEDADAPRRLPIVIQWKKGGQDVQLCGSFTQWKKMPMARSETKLDSEHMSIVNVPEGRHEYKFWVDGEWHVDTSEPTADAPGGGKHNYIVVKNADFKACDALNMESLSPANEASGSPPGPYAQICPETSPKPWASNQSMSPPPLPPHLLEVILNKDMSSTMEPTLLPAPNHVMLNHLYALSIKDGVMVLSATHRYRKKYVTTLLYKPIK